jgi:FAD/FMN-containing dehydrogenase
MNRIAELDGKSGRVVVEPGLNLAKLQQTLHTHGRFLPPYPAAIESTTLGGAIADNASGEKTVKYGTMLKYTQELRAVLANGEAIETKRLSKRELSKKLGLSTLEGEIYRALDTLIEENHDLINQVSFDVAANSAGYNLGAVKKKDGSFDLTPLLVGSQGTLAIITEAVLATEPHNPDTTLIAAFVDDLKLAQEAISEIRKLAEGPSSLEVINGELLGLLDKHNPNQLKGLIDKPFPQIVLLIEFDDSSKRTQKHAAKKATDILKHYEILYKTETEESEKERLWSVRRTAISVIAGQQGPAKPVPIIEGAVVPVERLQEYLSGLYEICKANHIPPAVWGHGGTADLSVRPQLDLSQVGDRQKIFRLMDDYYSLVIKLGGTISGGSGDGRLRAPYLKDLYGDEAYGLLTKVKQIFDPYGTLNPGVKIGVTREDTKPLLRYEYTTTHLYDHLPTI